ncbi:unnamed protein product, partial [Mesorhabditis belari]|uniref:Inositol polyphosphate-related phosphatase domain-containing protein n=1 Tax=Mesorhabditis belari TaxID=2138241 RepID=A0AAF3E8D0_9BILA
MNMNRWMVWAVTYNAAMEKVNLDAVEALMSPIRNNEYDLIVVGMQAVPHFETLGGFASTWQAAVAEWIAVNARTMTLVAKTYQATNQLTFFMAKKRLESVEEVAFRYMKSTFGGLTGHKGSIGLKVRMKGLKNSTSKGAGFVFVVSHFFHDATQNHRRLQQFGTNKYCTFPDRSNINARIWLGDLNFRVEKDSEEVASALRNGDFKDLLESDQLSHGRKHKLVFGTYNESTINFPPTYKLVKGTTEYDYRRTPSWCDRILFEGTGITCEKYDSIPQALHSDHLPVYGEFSIMAPSAGEAQWDVVFESIPTWLTPVPLVVRFQYLNNFWSKKGAYQDWIGIYPATIEDITRPLKWNYAVTCYETTINEILYSVAELSAMPAGTYRVGYFSANFHVLVGLSNSIKIEEVSLENF